MTALLAHPLDRPPAPPVATRTYTVTLTTPAFLGNATQHAAQWRTPPFKHLLREWWRVFKACQLLRDGRPHPDLHKEVRRAEALLFGHAWGKDVDPTHSDARASRLRMHLDNWDDGSAWGTDKGPPVRVCGEKNEFPAFIYTAFGPLSTKDRQFIARGALSAEKSSRWSITAPPSDWPEIDAALALVDRFGAVGSRSRNGWGSVTIDPASRVDLATVTQPWKSCLSREWPHALARLWRCRQPSNDWKAAIVECARTRKVINLSVENNKNQASERHVLSDPVTKNDSPAGGSNARLASQLRLKVAREGNKLRVYAYHLPCGVPSEMPSALKNLELGAWAKVHAALDRLMEPIA